MSGHDLIFQKIMMMVGLENLESLHRCEQVCIAWNAMHIGPPYGNPLYQSFTIRPLGVFTIGIPGLMSALRKWKNLLQRGLP